MLRRIAALAISVLCIGGLVAPVWAASPVWQVKKNGDVFYLAGTVHVLRAADYPLPDAFGQTFAKADQLILETDLAALQQPELIKLQQQLLFYPAGQQLSNYLKPATQQALASQLGQQGLPAAALLQLKPGALAAQLTMQILQKSGFSAEGVDQHFLSLAKQQGKTLAFLETPEFQLQLLGSLGQGREDEFVRMMLAEAKQTESQLAALIAAWRQGDVAALKQLALDELAQQDTDSYQRLFVQRNAAWLPQLTALSENQQTELVLVGAGHLVGPAGLLAQLEQAGYLVEQLP
jgi:hypothetical protein